jgi:hypothetical protein
VRFLIAALLVVVYWGVARADPDPVMQSRLNYEAGERFYAAGQFEDALHAFQSGYQLAARPGFLINIGQCLRALHRYREARAAFARFLVDAPTRDQRRKGAEEMVVELDREIAKLPPEPPPQPPPAPPKPPPPQTAAPASPAPVAPLVSAVPPPKKSRKLYWLIPVTLIVAAGVAVGLGVGLTQRPCPSGDLCVVADGPR